MQLACKHEILIHSHTQLTRKYYGKIKILTQCLFNMKMEQDWDPSLFRALGKLISTKDFIASSLDLKNQTKQGLKLKGELNKNDVNL